MAPRRLIFQTNQLVNCRVQNLQTSRCVDNRETDRIKKLSTLCDGGYKMKAELDKLGEEQRMSEDDSTKIDERVELRVVENAEKLPPPLPANVLPFPRENAVSNANLTDDSSTVDLGERYEVLAAIGRGGTGQVFKVLDKELNQIFAIKVLKKELLTDAQTVKRFINEANAAAGLSHSAVVSVYDHGEARDGSPYIIMNYIEGESLSSILKREGALDSTRVLDLFLQICEGLQYAHAEGLVHRDLKPSNIIVNRSEDGTESAYIVDFGIAKVIATRGDTMNTLTASGDFFGTPMYMSPEQCLGQNVDLRTDIYALGCMLYECLTGKPPFAGSSTVETIAKKIGEDFPLLSSKDILPGLSLIVASCTSKNANDRYPSVLALKQDLISVGRKQTPVNASNKAGTDTGMLVKRAVALFADWIIISSMCGVLNAIAIVFLLLFVQPFWAKGNEDLGIAVMGLSYFAAPLIITFSYYITMEPKRGATFGKQLLGLMITDAYGRKISFKQSVQRQMWKVVILWLLPALGVFGFYVSSQTGVMMMGITFIMSMLICLRFVVSHKQMPWDVLTGCQIRRR